MIVDIDGDRIDVTMCTTAGRSGENQDSAGWLARNGTGTFESGAKVSEDAGRDFFFAIVCDGMGGMNSGGMASSMAVDDAIAWARGSTGGGVGNLASDFVEAMRGTESRLEGIPGTGTTLSAVMHSEGEWASIHLGDSRCYRVGQEGLLRTMDHSPVEAMRLSGMIDEDEMNSHPMSNIISKYLGGGFAGESEIELLEGWSRLALCSDGAFGYMPPDEFRALMESSEDAGSIVQASFERGSRDNITVLMLRRLD